MPASRVASPLLVAVLLASCADGAVRPPAGDDAAPPEDVVLSAEPIEAVAGSSYTGIEDRRRLVIRERAEWEAFWRELAANQIPTPPAPEIDFGRSMVVAATMGTRPTGGYSIAIDEVAWSGGTIRVTVVETSPGEDCVLTQALTAPVAAVEVERREGEAVFVEREEPYACN